MKSYILLLIGSIQAIHIKNKDFPSPMYFTEGPKVYSKGSHWRKFWPEGAVDTTSDDPDAEFDIIDRFNHPVPPKPDPATPIVQWFEYEPHTTTHADQFQGAYHEHNH